jgi:NADP-dependent 3-hydroxy acid dehydrogenase YdfG
MGRTENKVVIVTGAASGLGAADARLLAAEGAEVILTDINATAGHAIAEEIGAEFIRQDVATADSMVSSTMPELPSPRISRRRRPKSGAARWQSISTRRSSVASTR